MDRLSSLTPAGLLGLFVLAGGCGGDSAPAPVPSRVDAVAAAPAQPVKLDAFCEVLPAADAAPAFAWPPLHSPAPEPTGRWTWVNVWATWCGPCVAEMPEIVQWPERLAARGAAVDLVLLSVDTDDAALAGFRRRYPETANSLHMVGGDRAPQWVGSFELGISESLPLHFLVDPQGKVRCVRSGALAHDAIDAIEALVEGG